jgi:hypothetical protein
MGGNQDCRCSNQQKIEADTRTSKSRNTSATRSTRNANHYLGLRDDLKHKRIRDLELQPRIAIVIGGVPVRYYPSGRQMFYVADFRFWDIEEGRRVIQDVKMQSGFLTEIYKFKRALVHTMGLTIDEV